MESFHRGDKKIQKVAMVKHALEAGNSACSPADTSGTPLGSGGCGSERSSRISEFLVSASNLSRALRSIHKRTTCPRSMRMYHALEHCSIQLFDLFASLVHCYFYVFLDGYGAYM